MYNLFYYNIDKITDRIYLTEIEKLSKIRRKEIERKQNAEDRKRSLVGDMLVKKYLSKLYNVPEEKLIFAKGEHGKPYVLNIPAHFSISHSGKYTVVAISNEPIGVDVEEIREFSAIVAHKTFNDDERAYIAGNSAFRKKIQMQKAFYEIWTAKEAYLKYTGEGLSGGINSLSFEGNFEKITPKNKDVELIYDFGVPGAVTAIVTAKHN